MATGMRILFHSYPHFSFSAALGHLPGEGRLVERLCPFRLQVVVITLVHWSNIMKGEGWRHSDVTRFLILLSFPNTCYVDTYQVLIYFKIYHCHLQ